MKTAALTLIDADGVHEALEKLRADEDPIVFLEVKRKQIEAMNVGSLVDRLMAMSDSRAHTLKLANRVNLCVSGWDMDPRELYEIPEVVKYFQLAAEQWNFWLYFLDVNNDSLGVFVRMLIDLDREKQIAGRVHISMRDPSQAPRVAQYLFDGFNALTAMHGFDAADTQRLSKRYADVVGELVG